MSDEQIDALPEALNKEISAQKAKIVRRQKDYARYKAVEEHWFEELNQIVNTPLEEVHLLPGRGWYGKKGYALPVALIYDRSDGQYEGFQLIQLETI